jgi:hypothetical protein
MDNSCQRMSGDFYSVVICCTESPSVRTAWYTVPVKGAHKMSWD